MENKDTGFRAYSTTVNPFTFLGRTLFNQLTDKMKT